MREREEANRHFKKKKQQYYLFEVTKTPAEYHIEQFRFHSRDLQGANTSMADERKDQIAYYHNKKLVS